MLHLVGCLYYSTNDARSHKHQIYKFVCTVLHTTVVITHYRNNKYLLIFCLKNSVKNYMESVRIDMKVILSWL